MQNAIALTIVAVAVCFLAWRAIGFFVARRRAGCSSGCHACPAGNGSVAEQKQLLTIAPLKPFGSEKHQPN